MAGPLPRAAGGPEELSRILAAAAAALGLTLPSAFPRYAEVYLDELQRWQRVGSLTAYRDRPRQVRHLILESLMLLATLPESASPLLDIGSGPGIPGLILKLARPVWDVTLVEAGRRRVNFLRHVVRRLALEGVDVHAGRAEGLAGGELHQQFQVVTMRAVAAVDRALALGRPFLRPEGILVLPVGPGGVTVLGVRREIAVSLPGELPWRRQFLIIPRAELDANVPRGTHRAHHRDREPERGRREDYDRRQPGKRAGDR